MLTVWKFNEAVVVRSVFFQALILVVVICDRWKEIVLDLNPLRTRCAGVANSREKESRFLQPVHEHDFCPSQFWIPV